MDETLVREALADPASAFSAIYDEYADRIHDHCLAILRDPGDAADAMQDTFVLAHERLGQLREPSKLRPWLYAIARSRCLRRLDARRRLRPTDELEMTDFADDPAAQVAKAEARELVWAAAEGLSPDDRSVLDAHLRHGLTGPELAAVLGVSPRRAALLLHRLKERMDRTIGAIVVLRVRRRDCPGLAEAAGEGALTPLVRKRVARHIDGCERCAEERRRLTPQLAYAAIPLAPAPARLRDEVLARAEARAPDEALGLEPTWRPDGFPSRVGQRRSLGWRAVAAVATVVLALLGGYALGRVLDGDPADVRAAPAPTTSLEVLRGSPSTVGATTRGPASVGPDESPAGTETDVPPTDPGPPETEPGDTVPPSVEQASIQCGPTITASISIVDAADPSPVVDLVLTHDRPGAVRVPLRRAPDRDAFTAALDRTVLGDGPLVAEVTGSVRDAAGNERGVRVTEDCTFFD